MQYHRIFKEQNFFHALFTILPKSYFAAYNKPLFQFSAPLRSLPPSLPNRIFFSFHPRKIWQIFHNTYSLMRLLGAVLNQLIGWRDLLIMHLRREQSFSKIQFLVVCRLKSITELLAPSEKRIEEKGHLFVMHRGKQRFPKGNHRRKENLELIKTSYHYLGSQIYYKYPNICKVRVSGSHSTNSLKLVEESRQFAWLKI